MSIRDQASADFRANVAADGESVTLRDPDGNEYPETRAVNVRATHRYDPQTGTVLDAPAWAITIPFAYLPRSDSGAEYTFPGEGWYVDASDVQDVQQSLIVLQSPKIDFTIGFVTLLCGPYEDMTS